MLEGAFPHFISGFEKEIFTQLTIAVLLGGLIGIERTLAHRLAGFRTFAMVSLGACVFTIISNLSLTLYGDASAFDPSRIVSQIVVGVGFLAGGTIIFTKEHLQGLTTSAGLWVSAGIGVAVGMGFYAIAGFVTILTILIFGLFWQIERRLVKKTHEHSDHAH